MVWVSGCLTLHNCLMLPPTPYVQPNAAFFISGKSVRLFDNAQSAASSHAPKKGCSLREVWRSQTCTSGSPFFCFLFFGEAKKSKCPAGMKRMVKVSPKANHKALTRFQAASITLSPNHPQGNHNEPQTPPPRPDTRRPNRLRQRIQNRRPSQQPSRQPSIRHEQQKQTSRPRHPKAA